MMAGRVNLADVDFLTFRRFLHLRPRGWWEPASPREMPTITQLSSESKPTPPMRISSSSSLSRWKLRQVSVYPLPRLIIMCLQPINVVFRVQPLVYTPPQKCSTLVHCDRKVWSFYCCYHYYYYFSACYSRFFRVFSSHTLCCRSPKTAESIPFKFRNKRCTDHSTCLQLRL